MAVDLTNDNILIRIELSGGHDILYDSDTVRSVRAVSYATARLVGDSKLIV